MPEDLRPKFWETVALKDMNNAEWEALCDGCGRCCLNKLEDADTGEVIQTRVACRLLDGDTCQCQHYERRHDIVDNCIQLTPKDIEKHAYWLPGTCAYRLLWQGKTLPRWHPLITGSPDTVHSANISVQGWSIPEYEVHEDDWEDYAIEDSIP